MLGITFFVLAVTPIYYYAFFVHGGARFEQVSITENVSSQVLENSQKIAKDNTALNRLVYNRRLVYVAEAVTGYISHLSPTFLFISGDPNPRHGPRNMGLLHLVEVPLLLLGIFCLVKYWRAPFSFIILWIALAPLPAALALPVPHALRSLNMTFGLLALCGLGLVFGIKNVPTKLRTSVTVLVSVVYTCSVLSLIHI